MVYCVFMSDRLIALDKKPAVCPVGVGGTWRHIFAKCVLRVTVPEATRACQYDHMCIVLKAGINREVHEVQDFGYTKSTTEDCRFLPVDAKNTLNEINQIIMLWTVHHLWPYKSHFFFNCYPHW